MPGEMKLRPADRLKEEVKENVWVEFVQVANEENALNLGPGFPDFAAPDFITRALNQLPLDSEVLLNQITRGYGHPRLVEALAKVYSKLCERNIDALNEFLVTFGAFEALHCAFLGFVNPGDEVIIVEPFFDSYAPTTRLVGGVPVFIPLRPPKNGSSAANDWYLDEQELESKFNEKTKMIVINTPNNPLGKVFTKDELTVIANLCIKYNCIALMDEVYEWIIYDDCEHIRMASLPNMWERTVTIGSAGKTFSITGWKVGWAYGAENLINAMKMVHQNSVYTCSTPIQEAVAIGFEKQLNDFTTEKCYWRQLREMLLPKRERMAKLLNSVEMRPVIPNGSYFMIAEISSLADKVDCSEEKGANKDYRFNRWLAKNKKIMGIPVSAFYSAENKHFGENYLRFCFMKKEETLLSAEKIIKNFKQSLSYGE